MAHHTSRYRKKKLCNSHPKAQRIKQEEKIPFTAKTMSKAKPRKESLAEEHDMMFFLLNMI